MKKFIIPATWTMYGSHIIEAENYKEAKEKALKSPLPEGNYLGDSFEIDEDNIECGKYFYVNKDDDKPFIPEVEEDGFFHEE